MSHRPRSQPDACSVLWEESSLLAAGTASRADFWVALEQTGPWGREASVMSHLDPGLGAELARACEQAGGRLLLIRRPGEHSDEHDPGAPRQVIIAGGLTGDPWLLEGEVDDPADLLTLPWDALVGDDPDRVTARLPLLEETRDAVLLVCTNGKRDVCCAVRGRPVVAAAAAARPGRVWECSHTGGHRFAPTAVTLPSGQMWGRLTADLAVLALDEEQRRRIPAELNDPLHNRGRSCLPPPAQAAEVVWRAREGELAYGGVETDVHPDALDPDRFDVVVRHRDGRSGDIALRRVTVPDLRESCRKPLGPVRAWQVAD